MKAQRRLYLQLVLVGFLSCIFNRTAREDDWPPISPEELSIKELPEQPGATAFVLNREETTDDPHNYKTVYVRLKILTEPGRKYADVEIPYSRRAFNIYDVSGRTIHGDGTVIPFIGKPFDKVMVRRKDRGNEERFQVKAFTMPDVQVGSIIEYRYREGYDYHSFYAPEWIVQTELFQRKVSFQFIPYAGLLKLAHDRVGNGVAWSSYLPKGSQPVEHEFAPAAMATSRTATGYVDLQMTNVPPLIHEPFMPPLAALRYRVDFYYTVERKKEDFWKEEGNFWNKDVENFLGRKNGVAEAVAGVVAASDTPEQKARKIYAFITTLDNWSYQPARAAQEDKALGIKADRGAEDVLRQHGGWHDDLNKLYVAMLRAAGIAARMMWVPSRDEEFFDVAFLNTRQLVAEIAIVQLNGKEMCLDPGTKYCPFGLLNWRYSNVRGIRQREGKGTDFVESTLPDYKQAEIQRLARVKMTSEGKAEGTIKVGFYGMEAMEWRQAGNKTDAEGRKKLLEDAMKRWLPADSEVKLVNTPNWDSTEDYLAATFEVSSPLAISAGKRWIIPVHIFQVNDKPWFSAADRTNPIYFDYLSREIDEIHVTLPPEMEVESLPPGDNVHLDYALYWTSNKQEKADEVVAVRNLTLAGLAFPPKMYKEVKGFFDKVKAGDDQPVVLKAAAHAELK